MLAKLDAPKLSTMHLERQLGYFGKLARRPTTCPVRSLIFNDDLTIRTPDFDRRRGRPKLEWARELSKVVARMFDSDADFGNCVVDEAAWRSQVRSFSRRSHIVHS